MLWRQEHRVLCDYQEIQNLWSRLLQKICFQLDEKGLDLIDGGIVSVDGFAVTEALSDQLYGEDREERSKEQRCRMSVWKMRVQICMNTSDITIKPLSLTTCRMSVWKMRV